MQTYDVTGALRAGENRLEIRFSRVRNDPVLPPDVWRVPSR